MCMSSPDVPDPVIAPPPAAPIAPLIPPKAPNEDVQMDAARLGKKKLQIPLAGSGSSGLGIPTG